MIGDPLANKDNKNVMSIVNKGANFLLSKFIGKKTASVDTCLQCMEKEALRIKG